jgi:hypothetical protein
MSDNDLIEIECNMDDPNSLNAIRVHSNKMHGLSLMALFMIESKNIELELNISYPGSKSLEFILENLISIWRNYKPSKSMIRSYIKNGEFLKELNNIKLTDKTHKPETFTEFNVCKNIIDINQIDKEVIIKIYRNAENGCRKLKLSYKEDLINDEKESDNAIEEKLY